MKLYSYFRSSTSWRVRIVLNYKKLPVQFQYVHLVKGDQKSEEYSKKNPNKGVPTLQLEDGTCLVQSMAICQYLEQKYPEKNLLPKDIVQKAKVRGFCEVINSAIHPYQNLRVINRLAQLNVDKMTFAKEWNERGLNTIQSFLKGTAGKYCFGDEVTLADAFLYPQLTGSAKRFGLDIDNYPISKKVCQNLSTLKEFIDASPQNQADFQK